MAEVTRPLRNVSYGSSNPKTHRRESPLAPRWSPSDENRRTVSLEKRTVGFQSFFVVKGQLFVRLNRPGKWSA
jgi:hypothetical protein